MPSFHQAALAYLQSPDPDVRTMFGGLEVPISEAAATLKRAGSWLHKQDTFFENGVVTDAGDEVFFSGYANEEAFRLSIIGPGVGLRIWNIFTDMIARKEELE